MDKSDATIFVIDDDASVRRGLARLLSAEGWSVETFSEAREFLERAPSSGTGCVVLDVRMPGLSGPELQSRMHEMGWSLPIVFLTGHGDVPTSVQAMKRGAVDFLLKPVDSADLLRTVTEALERHATELDRQRERREIRACLEQLTTREREVLEAVTRGLRNKQIAAELGISEKTVKVHRGRVMQKMRVRSVAELVRACESVDIRIPSS